MDKRQKKVIKVQCRNREEKLQMHSSNSKWEMEKRRVKQAKQL
jgi:hypothetical protein